jgi:hypothetical protein
MKPAWDKLMKKYKGHATALVADVDCTAGGKDLCEEHGVQGFPTIKWGDPAALEDYDGGRNYEDLETFADASLKPLCSPKNIELCEDDKKKQLEEMMAMSADKIDSLVEEKEAALKEAEAKFDAEVAKLQETYEALDKAKTATQQKIKESGLALMKSVSKFRAASAAGSGKEEM